MSDVFLLAYLAIGVVFTSWFIRDFRVYDRYDYALIGIIGITATIGWAVIVAAIAVVYAIGRVFVVVGDVLRRIDGGDGR